MNDLAGRHGEIVSHEIESAQSQVVAGVNYLLSIIAENGGGKHVKYVVKVFKPLPHTGDPMKITQETATEMD